MAARILPQAVMNKKAQLKYAFAENKTHYWSKIDIDNNMAVYLKINISRTY